MDGTKSLYHLYLEVLGDYDEDDFGDVGQVSFIKTAKAKP